MKTSKPISTISYNTADFLEAKLRELVDLDVLSYYMYVRHYPEDDETKPHYHVYMELGDTTEIKKGCPLQLAFSEIDPKKPDKPLGCMPFRKTHFFDDWYFYVLHHKAYLVSKGQNRKHQYTDDDFIVSDTDYFGDLRAQINYSKYFRQAQNVERIKQGAKVYELVEQGLINVREVVAYNALARDITYRVGAGHENSIDYCTGEVLTPPDRPYLIPLDDKQLEDDSRIK